MTTPIAPYAPKDRFEVYRFFNGISAEGKEGLNERYARIPLVKTFLLEHVSSRSGRTPKAPAEILKAVGAEVRFLDDSFLEVRAWMEEERGTTPRMAPVGYIEQYDDRFFAFYTAERADEARKRVRRWLLQSSELDHAWFSGHLLQSLWDHDVSKRGDDRFGKLVFRHESIFDMPDDATQGPDEEEENTEEAPEEDTPERDRRKARFEMGDRIGPIRKALDNLQRTYNPLNALYALRIPSRVGRGSHDLYQAGQVTNRSDSFEDHRNMVRYLYRTYQAVLERTEKSAWLELEAPAASMRTMRMSFKGVPLIVHFGEELSEATFKRWVTLAFQKRNQFRLWGDPMWLGPTKVHIYGADRHLWQPINIEMTAKHLVAILPKGTCGNTFHRLVTNIQRYVCPKIDVWLGNTPFQDLMGEAHKVQEESRE